MMAKLKEGKTEKKKKKKPGQTAHNGNKQAKAKFEIKRSSQKSDTSRIKLVCVKLMSSLSRSTIILLVSR